LININANEKIILDRAVAGILKQKQRSVAENNRCRYRGEGELKCAIGQCINDEYYEVHLESYSADSYAVTNAVIKSNSSLDPELKIGSTFLLKLQAAHDDAIDSRTFLKDFQHAVEVLKISKEED